MKSITIKLIALCALFTTATTAFAHEGHGFAGSHWHASDVAGFAALGILIVLAIWLSRK
jgi:Zn-dependent protease with chaperone function